MVKILLFISGLLFTISGAAQNYIVVSGGVHTIDVSAKDFNIINRSTADSFNLKFENASYGYHFGGGFRFGLRNFYIQPEMIFNSNKTNYKFTDFSPGSTYDSLKTEKYQYVDVILILGIKLSILRLHAGPVMHVFINNASELLDIEGYKDKFDAATFGYQAGIGFDFKFLSLDIRHEGNFSEYGDHIVFFGKRYNFDTKASRLIGTLSIRF